ncbi:MAG TPA: hypothetical protein VH497_08465 [Vicinamibacterales bacterium]|jgi:hypothetical protein
MRDRIPSRFFVSAAAAALFCSAAVVAQQPAPAPQDKKPAAAGGIPRTPDGNPDLQGTYDLGTITPMERAAGTPLVLTPEQARKQEQAVAARNAQGDAPVAADRAAPPKGGDGSPGPYGNVGGYNNFWLDPGSRFTVIDGQARASLLIDPPDGRVPPMRADARARNAARRDAYTSDQRVNEDDPGFEGPDAYNDPEQRPLGERCLVGFSSTSGPPILPTYFYNNLHQIVQTPTQVMILTEMVHDARVIRMNDRHLPSNIRKWLGDSIGHWEGDTLVVDTTNFTSKTRFRGSSENLHVVERFTRLDAKTLRYQFTIEDAATWDRAWTAEYAWPATPERIYEYACHEGNYALGNILRGARLKEKDEATKTKEPR